jgi:hypothetical protein
MTDQRGQRILGLAILGPYDKPDTVLESLEVVQRTSGDANRLTSQVIEHGTEVVGHRIGAVRREALTEGEPFGVVRRRQGVKLRIRKIGLQEERLGRVAVEEASLDTIELFHELIAVPKLPAIERIAVGGVCVSQLTLAVDLPEPFVSSY